jgi:hypothetical protein
MSILDLGDTTIDEKLYARDIACLFGGEECDSFGDLVRIPHLPSGTAVLNPSFISASASPCCKLSIMGV